MVLAHAESRNLAPGFTALPKGAKLALAPLDVELFSISAGGGTEPRADWTASAQSNMKAALLAKVLRLGISTSEVDEKAADDMAELLSLQAAVANSISLHHAGNVKLPTKNDKLQWSFGDVLHPLQERTGARYALFTWMRDSYASAGRKAVMVAMALLRVGIAGGTQVGYASLVDLETGQVLWFNQVSRWRGDLRESKAAADSMDVLLEGFPVATQ